MTRINNSYSLEIDIQNLHETIDNDKYSTYRGEKFENNSITKLHFPVLFSKLERTFDPEFAINCHGLSLILNDIDFDTESSPNFLTNSRNDDDPENYEFLWMSSTEEELSELMKEVDDNFMKYTSSKWMGRIKLYLFQDTFEQISYKTQTIKENDIFLITADRTGTSEIGITIHSGVVLKPSKEILNSKIIAKKGHYAIYTNSLDNEINYYSKYVKSRNTLYDGDIIVNVSFWRKK